MPRRQFSVFTLLLLAVALMARAVLPTGWMPVAQDGGVRIAICTGQGAVMAVLGPDGKIHPDAPEAPRNPCPFGMTGGEPFALTALSLLPATPLALEQAPVAARAAIALTIRRNLRPPARGPPAFA